jgi:hypothetical protein
LEMALCVAFTASHGTNRQHGPRLTLFEIGDQGSPRISLQLYS